MKLCLLFMGKTENGPYKELTQLFLKRIQGFLPIECIEIQDAKVHKKVKPEELKKAEAEKILKQIHAGDKLFLLDEKGKTLNSRGFANFLQKRLDEPGGRLMFCIGGAFGFDESVYQRAEGKIQLSDLTFNHQLARIVLAEQVYRGISILNNHPYHND